MVRSTKGRMTEPVDRRRMRLIQTMLAFPAAGILGFGGHVLVRSALAHEATASAPERPGETTDEKKQPEERGTESPTPVDEDAGRPRNV
jgi:hypothetical protein